MLCWLSAVCELFVNYCFEDDSVLPYITTHQLVSNCKLINVSKNLHALYLLNCLLNAFAICVGEVTVFSLKVIVLFLGCVGVLMANPCIVFQRVCVVFVIPVCV